VILLAAIAETLGIETDPIIIPDPTPSANSRSRVRVRRELMAEEKLPFGVPEANRFCNFKNRTYQLAAFPGGRLLEARQTAPRPWV
jgi:hypothetical protein